MIAAICQEFVVVAEPTSARVAGAEDFKIVTDQHGLLYDNSGGAAMTTERGAYRECAATGAAKSWSG